MYAELSNALLDERHIRPLAERTVTLNDLVISATKVLNESTYMLGAASDHRVRLIRELLDAEDAGDWEVVEELEVDFELGSFALLCDRSWPARTRGDRSDSP